MALSLAQVVAERTNALRLLEEAYEAQASSDSDRAVALDRLLEAARAKGFFGARELAAGVLRVSGRFAVQRGPEGDWQVVRQSTMVPLVLKPKSTALIPFPGPGCRALVPYTGPRGRVDRRAAAA